jgi:hypothetical protein
MESAVYPAQFDVAVRVHHKLNLGWLARFSTRALNHRL